MIFDQVGLEAVLHLRAQYRQEMNCQIVHDSHHQRGFTRLYTIKDENEIIGYGAIGDYDHRKKDVIKEFWIDPERRNNSPAIFREFIEATKANRVESQTNDIELTRLLKATCENIKEDRYLFDDGPATNLKIESGLFRRISDQEKSTLFKHLAEPPGEWCIETDGRIVATGGWLTHYNPPYADLYMEVEEPYRKRGFGSYLIQELRRECKSAGYKPAARTGKDNVASRRTLEKGGMLQCARVLLGEIPPPVKP